MIASDQPNIKKEKRMRNQSLFLKKRTALAMALMFLVASSDTRVEAAATQNLTSEQIEAVIEEVFTGLAALDAQGIVDHFAAEAVSACLWIGRVPQTVMAHARPTKP